MIQERTAEKSKSIRKINASLAVYCNEKMKAFEHESDPKVASTLVLEKMQLAQGMQEWIIVHENQR